MTRVLAVLNGLGTGGAERSTAESIEPLRRRGVDVEVACLFRRRVGVEAQVDATVHHLDGPNLAHKVAALRRLIRARRPAVVHTAIFEADLAGRLAAARTATPVLTSLVNTSYSPSRHDDPRLRRWKLEAARLVDGGSGRLLTDHFHAITRAVADAAVDHLGLRPERITVIPRGRSRGRLGEPGPERRGTVRHRLGLAEGTPMVLAVGRQEFQKDHVSLVRAFASLRDRGVDARLVLAGRQGSASAELQRAVDASGHERHIALLGHVDDVPDLLVAADAFAFPSRYEGLGGALIEAMGLGAPIVTTDLAVTREVAADAAVYVPPADPGSLGDALAMLLADEDLRADLGARGRRRFATCFELEAIMDRMAELYAQVAARPTRTLARR